MGNPAGGLGGVGGDSLLSDAAPSPQDRALATLGIQRIQAPLLDGTMGTFTIDPAILSYDFTQHNAAMNLLNNPPAAIAGSNNDRAPIGTVSYNPGTAVPTSATESDTTNFANAVSQMGQSGSPFGPSIQEIIATAAANPTPLAPSYDPNQMYARPWDGINALVPGNGAQAMVREFSNSALGNMADNDVAAIHATFPGLSSSSSNAPTWGQRYQENQQIQRAQSVADEAQHPVASAIGSAGATLLDVPESLGSAVVKSGILGGVDGFGNAIRYGENPDDGMNSVVGGAIKGTLKGAGLYGVRQILP